MIRLDATRFVLFQAGTLDESQAAWEAAIPSAELVLSRSRRAPSDREVRESVEADYGPQES